MAIFTRFESALTSVIAVDARTDTITFYFMNGSDRDSIQGYKVNCKVGVMDEAFLSRFDGALKQFYKENPQVSLQKTALVLPDHLFLMDTFKVPVIHRKTLNHSLDLAIETIYKNKNDLVLNKEILLQNRKQIIHAVCGVRKDLMDRLKDVCAANNVGLQGVTFAANAAVNGAAMLKPKLKNDTYLLLDIKENSARFAFVSKGKTVGYYSLPFGYAVMMNNRVAAEDMLFDHASGELLVLNAKERARAKQLTMAGELELVPMVEEEFEGIDELVENGEGVSYDSQPSGAKKTARRLPKFMLRPTPESREEYGYENFRLFVKWTLELIASNPEIIEAGVPEAVYVNMPEEFDFLYDMVNAEQEENKIAFAPLLTDESGGDKIARHLELFGGFYVNQQNKNCTF